MDRPRFIISAAEAQSMASSSALTLPNLLPSLVASARTLARPPISNFHVAAVGLGSSGRVFIGVNIEFPGLPLHHSIHAEQFLIINLLLNNEPDLLSFAVSAAPCGHCRQFLQELRNPQNIDILIADNSDKQEFTPLSHFLPHRFGPHDLLPEDSPLLLERHHNRLTLVTDASNRFCNGDVKLLDAALEGANESHAPYSECPSAVALVDCGGKTYKGCYVESAAFNPSLGPVQAALVAFVAGGGGDYDRIVGAVLVEKEGANIKQEETARLLLRSISPKCHFETFHCTSHP
ncbi:PREDICTED: cytidine deaminase 1 [Lupinus angustifolius]|nr:PREDICTED: cytidine deaminase 1 [Lupinus angustifolius]